VLVALDRDSDVEGSERKMSELKWTHIGESLPGNERTVLLWDKELGLRVGRLARHVPDAFDRRFWRIEGRYTPVDGRVSWWMNASPLIGLDRKQRQGLEGEQ
jgi:hypothetical protein